MGRIRDALVNGGLSGREFASIRTEMQEKNRRMLAMISAIASLSFLCVSLAGHGSGLEAAQISAQRIYQGLAAFSAVTVLVALTVLPRARRLTLAVCYIFLCAVFGFAIWVGTFAQPAYPATTFCVFLVALPLLILERPYRMALFTAAVSGLFLFCAGSCKEGSVFAVDVLNCLCFLFLSVTMGSTMCRSRMRELAQKKVIERQRDSDQLSGLLNKAAFRREIELENSGEPGTLLVIDIDNFKHFNDTCGHIYGDAVIHTVALNIRKMFPEPALAGRFGGDEFVIYQPGNLSHHEVERRAALLRHALLRETDLTERVTVSMGIAFSPGGVPYDSLFASADEALYRAKAEGKKRACTAPELQPERAEQRDGARPSLRALLSRLRGGKQG